MSKNLQANSREFGADDARALARSIIESEAGRQCCWSASAVETVAAIILWEAGKGDLSMLPGVPRDVLVSLHPDPAAGMARGDPS